MLLCFWFWKDTTLQTPWMHSIVLKPHEHHFGLPKKKNPTKILTGLLFCTWAVIGQPLLSERVNLVLGPCGPFAESGGNDLSFPHWGGNLETVCANKQMKLQRCKGFCHIIAPTALSVVTTLVIWQQESIFSASGRIFHRHPWHFTTMPTANANSNSSVDRVLAVALECISGESLVIRSFGANVQNETFSVALRHFVSDESNNTGALV